MSLNLYIAMFITLFSCNSRLLSIDSPTESIYIDIKLGRIYFSSAKLTVMALKGNKILR